MTPPHSSIGDAFRGALIQIATVTGTALPVMMCDLRAAQDPPRDVDPMSVDDHRLSHALGWLAGHPGRRR